MKKNNNNPFEKDNFDKIMRGLTERILFISDNIVKFISSPPKRFNFHLREIWDKITRLFRFSITFKLTFFSSFKILRKLIETVILFTILFLGFNIFLMRNDFDAKSQYISNNFTGMNTIKSTPSFSEHLKSYLNSEGIAAIIQDDTNVLLTTYNDTIDIFENTPNSENPVNINPEFILSNSLFYSEEVSLGISKLHNLDFYLVYKDNYFIDDQELSITFVKSLKNEKLYLQYFLLAISVLFLFFLLSCSRYISRLTKRIIRPVYTMNDAIKEINVSSLDTRLDIRGSQDELKDLALTVNNMFDRIQLSYEKQKQFVSDVMRWGLKKICFRMMPVMCAQNVTIPMSTK